MFAGGKDLSPQRQRDFFLIRDFDSYREEVFMGDDNYFLFIIPDIDKDPDKPTFRVLSFSGHEEISRPYVFRINLMATEENISGLIFKEAKFVIHMGDQSSTYYGVITHFDQLRKIDNNYYYQARLMPKCYLLSLYKMSDVYLDKGLPEIIRTVFARGGFTDYDYRLDLKGTYNPPADKDSPYNRWSYVCQYEETYLDFLSRLMEREGVYYYFEQGDGRGRMVITDDKIVHKQSEHKLFYKAPGTPSTGNDNNLVQEMVFHQRLLPKKVIMKNYNYERASQGVMKAEAFVSKDGREDHSLFGNVNIFGENFSSGEEGNTLARIRAQELLCRGETYSGFGTAVPMTTGDLKHLTHENKRFTGWYLVTEVSHNGNQRLAGAAGLGGEDDEAFSYNNSFTMIREDVQFRPRRLTAKPKIQGTMTAFIDSEGSGDFADLDSQGRYRVRLPFTLTSQSDGRASTRIRMATPFTGVGLQGYGMHLPLHKGAEVILAFRDGDPDQPMITGAVFNSQNLNVVNGDNYKQHVIRTPGGNQIVMDDTPGKQSMYLFSPFGTQGNWLYLGQGGTGTQAGAFKGEKGDKGDKGDKGEQGEKGESGEEEKSIMHVKASGNKHELILGQEDSFVIGSENYLTIGSKSETMLGTQTEFTAAMKSVFEWAGTIECKAGHHIEFGKTTERIKDEDELLGTEKVTIAGGLPQGEKAVLSTLAKAMVFGGAAVGAILAAAAGDLGAQTNPEGKGDTDLAWKQGLTTTSAVVVGAAAQVLALSYLVKKLNMELTHAISKIELSNEGIKATALGTAPQGIRIAVQKAAANLPLPDTYLASISMSPDNEGNIQIATGITPGDVITGSSITVGNTNVKIQRANNQFLLGAASVNIQNSTPNTAKFVYSPVEIQLQKQTAVAKVASLDASLKYGANGFTVKAAETSMVFGGKAIRINAGSVDVGGAVTIVA